jgi:dTDP-4-amino-4,6-dideoxygalactose transaminase
MKIGIESSVRSVPFASWPNFEKEEIEAAVRVLESGRVNYWTGEEGKAFEADFAKFTGAPHAIAVANGTVALELALHALGIGPGDEVITTSRTFIASASAVVMRGAVPVFADVDPDSQNLTAETVRRAITPRTRAIIAVHLAGWPCDMDPIVELAREFGLKVIEDCAQAQGALYKGRMVGTLGDAAAFSFCQDKIMTTGGEGGMLVMSDPDVWEKAWAFKDHGKSYKAVYHREHPPGFRWLHESFGTNWRMTEMQAAIGRVLLRRLPQWIEARRRNAALLDRVFHFLPGLRVPRPPSDVRHAYYKYYAFVDEGALREGWSRDRIIEEICRENVPCFSGSCSEVYREKAFASGVFQFQDSLPVARSLGESSLMFLVHPTLGEAQMQETGRVVGDVLRRAVRDEALDGRHASLIHSRSEQSYPTRESARSAFS